MTDNSTIVTDDEPPTTQTTFSTISCVLAVCQDCGRGPGDDESTHHFDSLDQAQSILELNRWTRVSDASVARP